MNIEKKIVSNIKKEDEDDFEYEYVLEIEHFNSYKILKQVSYKETWNRLLKRFTLMDNCFNEKNDNFEVTYDYKVLVDDVPFWTYK